MDNHPPLSRANTIPLPQRMREERSQRRYNMSPAMLPTPEDPFHQEVGGNFMGLQAPLLDGSASHLSHSPSRIIPPSASQTIAWTAGGAIPKQSKTNPHIHNQKQTVHSTKEQERSQLQPTSIPDGNRKDSVRGVNQKEIAQQVQRQMQQQCQPQKLQHLQLIPQQPQKTYGAASRDIARAKTQTKLTPIVEDDNPPSNEYGGSAPHEMQNQLQQVQPYQQQQPRQLLRQLPQQQPRSLQSQLQQQHHVMQQLQHLDERFSVLQSQHQQAQQEQELTSRISVQKLQKYLHEMESIQQKHLELLL